MLRRIKIVLMMLTLVLNVSMAQTDSMAITDRLDSIANEQLMIGVDSDYADIAAQPKSLHQQLKTKFIEGNAGFMALVALALVLGLAFCIERIIYLSLSHINAKKLMANGGLTDKQAYFYRFWKYMQMVATDLFNHGSTDKPLDARGRHFYNWLNGKITSVGKEADIITLREMYLKETSAGELASLYVKKQPEKKKKIVELYLFLKMIMK